MAASSTRSKSSKSASRSAARPAAKPAKVAHGASRKAPAPRVLWKGAISFGLVHIPVALYSATVNHAIDFDWLDKRSMDPVGYKRINKKTGREIPREQIVKGVEYQSGEYVVLGDAEIAAAYPQSTQTVDIQSFVPADSIPCVYLERPYYVAPINRGAKVYALLRETLKKSGRVGLAKVVIQTRQHLAALVPSGPGLVLNLLRWGADIRPWKDLPLPAEDAKKAGLSEREMQMAKRLVEEMSSDWNVQDYEDSFKSRILALIDKKIDAGQTEEVSKPEVAEAVAESGGKVVDLTELLQRSLGKAGKGGIGGEDGNAGKAAGAAPAKRPAARRQAKRA